MLLNFEQHKFHSKNQTKNAVVYPYISVPKKGFYTKRSPKYEYKELKGCLLYLPY